MNDNGSGLPEESVKRAIAPQPPPFSPILSSRRLTPASSVTEVTSWSSAHPRQKAAPFSTSIPLSHARIPSSLPVRSCTVCVVGE